MNFSSADLVWTNRTSAPPRRPVSNARPVSCATTLTSMPLFAVNSGRIWSKRPESCIDVVAATTMNFVCAEADVSKIRLAVKATKQRRFSIMVTPNRLDRQLAGYDTRGELRWSLASRQACPVHRRERLRNVRPWIRSHVQADRQDEHPVCGPSCGCADEDGGHADTSLLFVTAFGHVEVPHYLSGIVTDTFGVGNHGRCGVRK